MRSVCLPGIDIILGGPRGSEEPVVDVGVAAPDVGVEALGVPLLCGVPSAGAGFLALQIEAIAGLLCDLGAPPSSGKRSCDCVSTMGPFPLGDVSWAFCFPVDLVETGWPHVGSAMLLSTVDSSMLADLGASPCFRSSSSGTSSMVALCASSACFCINLWAAESSPLPPLIDLVGASVDMLFNGWPRS